MADDVKRVYSSTLRENQARETRRLVVTAAAALFETDGYGATTIDAVAAAAGVSRKTVFSVGGKLELLKLALDWAIAGDDEPVAMADRAEIYTLFQRDDPAGILRDWLKVQVAIDARIAALFEALEVAAGVDPEARELRIRLQGYRRDGALLLVTHLAKLGALRPGLTKDRAADLAWLATDPVVFSRLVRDRTWSIRRFEAWLVDSTLAQLLDEGGPRQ